MQPSTRTVGVTIDGYAVEGGYDTDDGAPTSFGVAQALGRVRRSVGSPSTFSHLPELVDRLGDLGVREVRLTMEWARLEPHPDDFDDDAFGVYERALEAASRRGVTVVVVLCDVAWPSWLGQEPWLSTWAPVRFASHAGRLGAMLDGRLRALVTFRAPNAAARRGWLEGIVPPFRRRAAADASSALDGMLLAHQLASDELASRAPNTPRALLVEASWRYEEERALHDLARGLDESARHASELAWRTISAATGERRSRRARRRGAPRSLRSTARWGATPPCEWWVAGDELELLGAVLDHAVDAVPTIELGAGPRGWATQLDRAPRVLEHAHTVHLHGALGSTGPLNEPVGLLRVDQHGGAWTLEDPDASVLEALARLS